MGAHAFELNQLINIAAEQGQNHLEGYVMNLENMLANTTPTPELESFLDTTIEFLYGVIEG